MAVTARTLINQAAVDLGVYGRGLDGLKAQQGLDLLNRFLQSLSMAQFRLSEDIGFSDEVAVPDELRDGITALFAVRWAPSWGVTVPPPVAAVAEMGDAQLASFRLRHGTAKIDDGLLMLPSQRFVRGN